MGAGLLEPSRRRGGLRDRGPALPSVPSGDKRPALLGAATGSRSPPAQWAEGAPGLGTLWFRGDSLPQDMWGRPPLPSAAMEGPPTFGSVKSLGPCAADPQAHPAVAAPQPRDPTSSSVRERLGAHLALSHVGLSPNALGLSRPHGPGSGNPAPLTAGVWTNGCSPTRGCA